MASGDSLVVLRPTDGLAPGTGTAPTIDFRNGQPVLDFDAAATETIDFDFVLPRHYGGGGITAKIHGMASTATTGAVRLGLAYERRNTDADADSFATQNLATVTANATSGIPFSVEIAHTSGAQIDSAVAGDPMRARLQRVGGDAADTMAGDYEYMVAELRET